MDKPLDLVIQGARVIDGLGGPSREMDVGIRDDRIAAMGDLGQVTAGNRIDAAGKALTPGFIDVHTHDDRALLTDSVMDCKTSQGVTTVVAGNCGISLAPYRPPGRPPAPIDLLSEDPAQFHASFSDYFAALDRDPPAVNAVAQVGHSTLRAGAVASLDRPASPAEIRTMRARLEEGLVAGAIGMSTGLYYAPAAASPTSEVVELATALAEYGAIHTTHMRDESDHIEDSLEETFEIGRQANVPVVISHFKCSGVHNHGRSVRTLQMVDQARSTQRISLDAYPYVASSTVLQGKSLVEASRVVVAWSRARPETTGRDLDALAAEMGCSRVEAAAALSPAGGIFFSMSEDDVRRILSYAHTMIGSDGLPHDTHPHPRLWGTFPRVLGHYARDVGLFSLEEAVRRMTSLPAARFGLRGRGVIREGAHADLVLLDPATVLDRSTFEDPCQPADGIELVLVNGRAVWRDGASTGNRPGRGLRLSDLGPMGEESLDAQPQ